MLSSRNAGQHEEPTSLDFPSLPDSYTSFRAQLLKISSFAHNRRKEEKVSIEKLYSELSQIDERMWAKLTKTQTLETGTRRNAAEAIEEKLERLIRKLSEKRSKLKSGSIVEGGVHWPRLVGRNPPLPEEIDSSFETFNLNVRLLNNVDYGAIHSSVRRARFEISNALSNVNEKEWQKLEETISQWHRSLSCAAEISDLVLGVAEDSMNGLKAQQLKFANIEAFWLDRLASIYIPLPALPKTGGVFIPTSRNCSPKEKPVPSLPSSWAEVARPKSKHTL
ncbi:hypothetical protein JCM5350_003948 [Sporobolomyces pararoseus]